MLRCIFAPKSKILKQKLTKEFQRHSALFELRCNTCVHPRLQNKIAKTIQINTSKEQHNC